MTAPDAPRKRIGALEILSGGAALLWLLGAWESRSVGVWAGIAGTGITLGILAVVTRGRPLLARLRPTRGAVLSALLAAAVMLAATYALYPLSAWLLPGIADVTAGLYSRFGTVSGITWLLLPLAVSSEELVWRGLVQDCLERRMKPAPAALLAAAAYGAAHLPAGAWLAALALTCGLYWGLLRAYTGSLLVPLVAHLAWDFAVMVLFPLTHR